MGRGETRGSVSESMRRKKKQREGRKNERAYHKRETAPKKKKFPMATEAKE